MVQIPWVSVDSQHLDAVTDDVMSTVSSSTSTQDTLVVPPNMKKAKKAAEAKAKAQKELEKRGFVMHDGDLAPMIPPLPWENLTSQLTQTLPQPVLCLHKRLG